MTLISTSNRVQHLTDGQNILWSVPFAFHEAAELHVVLSDPDGGDAGTLVLDTDYVVSGGDGATGWVTFPAAGQAHPTGKMLTVIRILDVNQPTDVGGLSLTWADKVEREIDRSRMIDQQLQEQIDRCVKAPETADEAPPLADLEALSEAAQDAATDAAAARDAAQAAQAGAETAAADAATARDAAQAAQAGAEAARDQAVTAQGAAETAQSAAEAAEAGAQAAQASAETARDQAQSYAEQINTGQFSPVDHNHDGVYEPVDPDILRSDTPKRLDVNYPVKAGDGAGQWEAMVAGNFTVDWDAPGIRNFMLQGNVTLNDETFSSSDGGNVTAVYIFAAQTSYSVSLNTSKFKKISGDWLANSVNILQMIRDGVSGDVYVTFSHPQ